MYDPEKRSKAQAREAKRNRNKKQDVDVAPIFNPTQEDPEAQNLLKA